MILLNMHRRGLEQIICRRSATFTSLSPSLPAPLISSPSYHVFQLTKFQRVSPQHSRCPARPRHLARAPASCHRGARRRRALPRSGTPWSTLPQQALSTEMLRKQRTQCGIGSTAANSGAEARNFSRSSDNGPIAKWQAEPQNPNAWFKELVPNVIAPSPPSYHSSHHHHLRSPSR